MSPAVEKMLEEDRREELLEMKRGWARMLLADGFSLERTMWYTCLPAKEVLKVQADVSGSRRR